MQMHKVKLPTVLAAAVVAGLASAHESQTENGDFGSAKETAFAENMWSALAELGLVGENALQTHPYAGTSQHGPVVQYLDGTVSIGDESGVFILKRNYRGEDVSVEEVFRNPERHFDSIGVMFRREDGYAPEEENWFWVKYMPDGEIATTPAGKEMAGRVTPCISCHQPADGEDFVWSHDRFAQ